MSDTNIQAEIRNQTQAPIEAMTAASLTSPNGLELHIDELCCIPTFIKNLLSVHHITNKKKCSVHLTDHGGDLLRTDWKSLPEAVLATIQKCNGEYRLKLRPETQTGRQSWKVQKQTSSITKYWRRRKLRPGKSLQMCTFN